MKIIKSSVSFTIVFALLISCFTFNVFAEDSVVSAKLKVEYGQSAAREILPMINELRTGSDAWYWNEDDSAKVQCDGLKALSYDYSLEKVAMQRAAEAALRFSHYRTDNTICFTAFEEFLYSGVNFGENITAGAASASGANKLLREDDEKYAGQGHRRNMLSSDYNVVGIGHVTYNSVDYWVELFANTDKIDNKVTDALNESAEVPIKLSTALIGDVSISAGGDKVVAKYTKESELSDITVSVKVQDNFPGVKCALDVEKTFSVGDPDFAQLKDGKIIGTQLGETQLSVTALGKTEVFPLVIICEHEYEVVSKTEATCTSSGIIRNKCKICGHINEEEIPMLAHKMTHHEGVEPTCTKTGSREYWHCSECGLDYLNEIGDTLIDPDNIELGVLNHMIESIGETVKATHFKSGSTAGYKCSVCGQVFEKPSKGPDKKPFGKIKLKGTAKGFKVSWNKISGASGLKIKYSLKSNFKSAKTVTLKKYAKSAVVKKLKSNKKYYVRVRAYRNENGKKLYSTWSTVGSVKTK